TLRRDRHVRIQAQRKNEEEGREDGRQRSGGEAADEADSALAHRGRKERQHARQFREGSRDQDRARSPECEGDRPALDRDQRRGAQPDRSEDAQPAPGMTGTGSLVGVLLGIALGARHAFEPDHLAAVSVLAADGPSARRGALIGALWGAGHTLSLLACGLAVAVAATQIPPGLSDGFELAVAAML